MKNISNINDIEAKNDIPKINIIKDKQALFDAWKDFKIQKKSTQRSWANFLHYLKKNHNGSKNNYFGYKGTELRVYGDKLELELENNNTKIIKKDIDIEPKIPEKKPEKEIQKELEKTLIVKDILNIAGIIAAIILITIGGVKYLQEQKNNTNDLEKLKISKIQNIPKIQTIHSNVLLADGITQQDLTNAVNKTINKKTKQDIIDFVNKGNILGLQSYLGMKQNSKYALNNATGIIDENTMNILNGGLFGSIGNEILNNLNISQDVKDKYLEFMDGRIDNENKNYLIESKFGASSFLFDKNHRLIDHQDILLGRDISKNGEYLPFGRYYENGERKYYQGKNINRNTPEGLFLIKGVSSINKKHYEIDGPKLAILLAPEKPNYDTSKIALGIHPPFIPKNNPKKYLNALKTLTTADNYQSKGCINALNFGRILDNISKNSKVYITEYNKYKQLAKQEKEKKQSQSQKYAQNINKNKQNIQLKNQKLIAQNIR